MTGTDIVLDLTRRIKEIENQVDLIEIKNDFDYYDADNGMARSLNVEKQVIKEFQKRLTPAKKEVTDLRGQEKTMLSAIKNSCDKITIKMSDYISKRDEVDRVRREAAHQIEIKSAEVEAFKMVENGVAPEVANLVIEHTKEFEIDLAPLQELKGRTKIGSTYKIELIAGEDELLFKTKNLLLPTTSAMKEALKAKIKALVKATGVHVIPGVKISKVPNSKRKDVKNA